jgi:hypothetical protein
MSIIDSWRFLFRGTAGCYDSSLNTAAVSEISEVPDESNIVQQDDHTLIVSGKYQVRGPSTEDRKKMAAYWDKTSRICRYTMNPLIAGEIILGKVLLHEWVGKESAPFHNNWRVETIMIIFVTTIFLILYIRKDQVLERASEHSEAWKVDAQTRLADELLKLIRK